MNNAILKEIIRQRGSALKVLLVLFLATLAVWGYASLWQAPALAKGEGSLRQAQVDATSATGTPASRYRAAEGELKLFRDRVIDKRDFPSFLARLFDRVAKNGLAFKQVTYKPLVIPDEGMVSYDIGFTVSGRYAQVKSFIADLARFREIVTLDSVNLANTSPTEERVELRVQITAYLKREGA